MYSLGIYQNNTYTRPAGEIQAGNKNSKAAQTLPVQNSAQSIPFTASKPPLHLRTELTTKEEKVKYSQISANLDSDGKKSLEILLKTGILLGKSPEDKSSTMDSLYKMITTPRATGLSPNVVLATTVYTLANPETIPQTAEDIPKPYVDPILKVAKKNKNIPDDKINEETINVERTSTCVAASIEFKLAKQHPAEFARFAEALTSPKMAVKKTIHLNNLADSTLDAVWLLNAFEVPYEMKDFKTAKLTLAPDKNAILRAQIQNSNKDSYERSLIDVLMQSTFMNVGSQQAYNSLTDKRGGKFSQNDKGLIEFEKTFVESIVEDINEISVTYQIIDMDGKLSGRETDLKTTKKHILDSLKRGEGIIIGYTSVDSSKKIIESHEITIIDAKPDKNGKIIFTCFDSDDGKPHYIHYTEDYIIPKIHHAGLPKAVAEKDVKFTDAWIEGVNAYKEAKNNPPPQPKDTPQPKDSEKAA